MKLNILLHDFSRDQPFGGLKQQYEFANRLSRLGHDVAVYHSLNFDRSALARPRSLLGLAGHNARGSRAIRWFGLDSRVRCRYLPRIAPRLLRRADATIISSARVAERIPQASARTGTIFYVVYEFPVWRYGRDDLKDLLASALQRDDVTYIASSEAVEEMLAELGVTAAAKITCGIELPELEAIPPTADREPVVGFALRPEPYKGARDMLEAIRVVRSRHPELRFECFGRFSDDLEIPEGLDLLGYIDDDKLGAFYRRCQIFVSPSYSEGWGLTAAEAMANGAAVVVTDDGGSRDFATHRETALVVPPRDPESLAAAISTLAEDGSLRDRIVSQGVVRSREMSWSRSVGDLERIVASRVGA